FGILAVEVRQQALDIVVGIRPLFLRGQRLHERLQKSFQTRHDTVEHARADLRVVQQFAQPNSKTSFHRQLSFRRFLLLKGAYTTSTYSCSRPRHSRSNQVSRISRFLGCESAAVSDQLESKDRSLN